jgi:predicted TPR repeat methyltransferase
MDMTSQLERAIRLHQAGNLELAENRYEAILEASPGQPDALHFLGLLHFQKGDADKAESLIRQAIEIRPDYADAHINLGNILKGQGWLSKAAASFRKAAELRPEDHNAHNNLCVVLKALGQHEDAVASGREAVALSPQLSYVWLNLGSALIKAGEEKQAMDAFAEAIRIEPELDGALDKYSYLRELLEQRGDISAAPVEEQISVYEKMLKEDPGHPIARHMLVALKNESAPERAADDYVVTLFDEMAEVYDYHLAALACQVPQLVQARLESLYPDPQGNLAVLDAGCGTGLLGEYLRGLSATLTGVDLSPQMIRKSAETGKYHHLYEAELTEFLGNVRSEYDLVVCADTLCYFGRLDEILAAIRGSLKPGGRLAFTTELSPDDEAGDGFILHGHGRYSHRKSYISELLGSLGMEDIRMESRELRRERGEGVSGCVVSARVCEKPA